MRAKVTLVTAGLAPKNFERAAERLVSQAETLYDFSRILVLNVTNLPELCPATYVKYSPFLKADVKGFGFWSWKSEIVMRAMSGDFGETDQVIWIDSGCELNSNFMSRRVFLKRILESQEKGYWFHALESSDRNYSKYEVIRQFRNLGRESIDSPQIQANYFHLSGDLGIQISSSWFKYSIESIDNLNIETSQEDIAFLEHRSDQSLLSLVAKSNGAQPNELNLVNGQSIASQLRGIDQPVWIARNRDGQSKRSWFLRALP